MAETIGTVKAQPSLGSYFKDRGSEQQHWLARPERVFLALEAVPLIVLRDELHDLFAGRTVLLHTGVHRYPAESLPIVLLALVAIVPLVLLDPLHWLTAL